MEFRRQDELNPFEAAQRQRRTLINIIRLVFIVLLATVTLLTIYRGAAGTGDILTERWPITLVIAAAFGIGAIAIDILTPQKKISTLFSILFGLLGALLVTAAIGFVIDLLAASYELQDRVPEVIAAAKLLIGICLAYLGITAVLQTQDDFRLVIPYTEFAKQIRGVKPLVLDTSSLIDARIVDLARTGVVQSPVVIPHFVLGELQQLNDSADKLKRSKGRRGLEMANRLQRQPGLDVSIDEKLVPGKAVDQMVIALAREMDGMIVTADVGLGRIAEIQDVGVLNLNDIANALKPALVPGERLRVQLIKAGEQEGQAVGYLEDGTMVVAESASDLIGEQSDLIVTSSLQTSAGRMIFARPEQASANGYEEDEENGFEEQDPGGPIGPGRGARRGRRGRNPRR